MWINPKTLELNNEPADDLERVIDTPCPLTERLEKAIPDGAELIDGLWYVKWRIEPLTSEEILQVEEAERINAGQTALQLIARNNAAYEAAIERLTADYPPSEIATWERQRSEALAWGADPLAATPWIDLAASARGLDRDAYLGRTLAKVHAFALASAWLTGRRQGIDDAIRAARTPAALAAIVIDYTLPAGGDHAV